MHAVYARANDAVRTRDTVHHPWNIVLGLADGYDISHLQRFVCSLRATGYQGLIVFGARSITHDTLSFLGAAHVLVELFDPQWTRSRGDFMLHRFMLYARWLSKYEQLMLEHGKRGGGQVDDGWSRVPRYALATDVRDVVFQRHPFASIPDSYAAHSLHLFLESGQWTFRNATINRHWINGCMGIPALTQLESTDASVVNAGVFWGTYDGVARGSKLLYEVASKSRACVGRDQALLNVLVHTGQFGTFFAAAAASSSTSGKQPLTVALHSQGEPGAPVNVVGIGVSPRDDPAGQASAALASRTSLDTARRARADARDPLLRTLGLNTKPSWSASSSSLPSPSSSSAGGGSSSLASAQRRMSRHEIPVSRDGYVLDDDERTVSPVVHQYDRHARLVQDVYVREPLWITPNPHAPHSLTAPPPRCIWTP